MGLFTKIVIAAGVGLASKIVNNKAEEKREQLELKRESEQLRIENEKLRIRENTRIEEMKYDYEMERQEKAILAKVESFDKGYCASCGKSIDKDSKFCGYCGNLVKIKEYCTYCGKEVLENAMFCGYCGRKKR